MQKVTVSFNDHKNEEACCESLCLSLLSCEKTLEGFVLGEGIKLLTE